MLNGIKISFCKLPVFFAANCAELGASVGKSKGHMEAIPSRGRTSLQSEFSKDRIDGCLKNGELLIPNGIDIKY